MQSDALSWLRWVLIPQLGLKRSHKLLDLIDSPESLFLHPDRWPIPDSIKTTIREMNLMGEQHPVHRRALEQLHWAESANNSLVMLGDDNYPASLSNIIDAPLVLWGQGDPLALKTKQIGIVGSRHASPNALRHSTILSRKLTSAGLTITSGGAKGIDSTCHQACLEDNGTTIAVLGCGIDVIYPKSNRKLFSSISQNGLLLSEYPLGTQPRPGHFPRRNRLISALSDIIIVVEAALKSGSLITAQHALEQGKDIFAMPGDISNPNSEGCHRLIQDGAFLLSDANDILNHLQLSGDEKPINSLDCLDHLTPTQQQIITQLRFGMMPIDGLSHQLGLAVHQLLEPILELELEGMIEQQPGGYTLSDIA